MSDIPNIAYFATYRRVLSFENMAPSRLPSGAFGFVPAHDTKVEEWMRTTHVNLRSFFYATVPGTWKVIRELDEKDVRALQEEFRPVFKDYVETGWSRLPHDIF